MNSALELLSGIGSTQANSLHDANMQRLDAAAMREHLQATLFGTAQTNARFAKWKFPYDVYMEAVYFNAQAGAPVGADLTCKFYINNVEGSVTFTLTDGQDYAETTDSSNSGAGTLIPAGQTIEPFFPQVGSSTPGFCVQIIVRFRKRVVSL